MIELDERTRRDLDQLREREGPSAAAKQRMFAALELELADGPGGDGPDGEGLDGDPSTAAATTKGGLGFAAKVVGATLALTGIGLVTLRLGVLAAQAIAREPAPDHAPQAELRSEPTPRQADLIAPVPEAVVEEQEAASADERPGVDAQLSAPKTKPQAPASASASASESGDTDSLAAELSMLEAASAAVDAHSALVALDRHRDRFPKGQLADEREIMRIEALCELDNFVEARKVAQRFLAARPSSPLHPRVRSACPELGQTSPDGQQTN